MRSEDRLCDRCGFSRMKSKGTVYQVAKQWVYHLSKPLIGSLVREFVEQVDLRVLLNFLLR